MVENNPVMEFAVGTVRAAIWENERQKDGQQFTTHTVQIERRYSDTDGNWSSTNRFSRAELAAVQLVAAEAYKYLSLKDRSPAEEQPATTRIESVTSVFTGKETPLLINTIEFLQ